MLLWRETEMKEKKIQNKRMETEKKIRDTLLMLFNFPTVTGKKLMSPQTSAKLAAACSGCLAIARRSAT